MTAVSSWGAPTLRQASMTSTRRPGVPRLWLYLERGHPDTGLGKPPANPMLVSSPLEWEDNCEEWIDWIAIVDAVSLSQLVDELRPTSGVQER